ncbi:MAG: hypothetical protein M3238_08985 [Actinomycetota bacterium]|nr:hypothetical protein [Actinomycetota bacterium]
MGPSGRLILIAATTALTVTACGEPASQRAAEDVLFLRSGSGVAVVETGANSPTYKNDDAVPSGDWSTVVRGDIHNGTTDVVATDPSSGVDRWADVIPGRLRAQVVSHDGNLVALSPRGERYYRYGRSRTRLIIAGRGLSEERIYTLDGNYEPEAFSRDGSNLFVVSYLPARAPTQYQVRRLDLRTGRVHAVFTPHAELQRPMGGTARIQTASPDGSHLYTLYTVKDGSGHRHAFIHVLNLDDLWAHCIDLPDDFATTAEKSTALTSSPDGKHLYVANTSADAVADIDTEALSVVRTGTFDFDSRASAHAAHDADGSLYIASGYWVVAIDTAELTERARWDLPDRIKGLQISSDAATLYVGLDNRVARLDAVSGETLELVDPPGVRRISRFGPVLQTEDEEPTLTCAC